MAQSGWRLPDELLKRVRVRCAEEGVRQNAWVERALEKALGDSSTAEQPKRREPNSQVAGSTPARSASSRASAPLVNGLTAAQRSGEWTGEEIAASLEPKPAARKKAAKAPPLGKGFVPPRPKGT